VVDLGAISLRFPCEIFPGIGSRPAFPDETQSWAPILNIRLSYRHSPPTKSIACWIDSGADVCIFHAGICDSLGIRRLEDGIKDYLQGVTSGPTSLLYFHKIRMFVFGDSFETMAGFSHDLAVTGLLGRRGFFDNFVVKFDASAFPPYCEIEKIHRA
jgi:hypothetical protein